MTPFAVSKRDDGAGVFRLLVGGELDEDTSGGLSLLIANAAEQDDVKQIIVDLRRVTFLTPAGLRALLDGRDAAAEIGRTLQVVNATGIVLEVLRVSKVEHMLPVVEDPGTIPVPARR